MAEMIRRMEELGTPPEAMLVMREYLSRDVTRDIRDSERDKQRDMARERQRRHRAKLKAEKGLAEANDAASTAPPERDKHRDERRDAGEACLLTSTPFLNSEEAIEEESKKDRGVTRARGTRIAEGMSLPDEFRQLAIAEGLAEPGPAWAEFVDYWCAVPGQRGLKTNWRATWRNNVRRVLDMRGKKHGYRNGAAPRTELQLALDKARKFAARGDQEYAPVPEDEPSNRH